MGVNDEKQKAGGAVDKYVDTSTSNDVAMDSFVSDTPNPDGLVYSGDTHSNVTSISSNSDNRSSSSCRNSGSSSSSDRGTLSDDVFLQSLNNAEGGYADILPKWALPKIQIRACVEQRLELGTFELVELPYEINALNVGMAKSILNQFSKLNMSRIHHYAQLGEFSSVLFKDKLLIDVLIHVEKRTFYAHRNVLSCHSEFFAGILLDNCVPPRVITDFTLYSINPDLFKDFIHFIYFGEIDITSEKLQPLLTLCDILKANIMRARIHMYMSVTGSVSSEFIKQSLLDENSLDKALAIQEAIHNFTTLLLGDLDALTRLSLKNVHAILSADALQVRSELDVFWASIFWLAYDPKNRVSHMDKLMETVRFTCMSTLELIDCCKASKLLRLSDTSRLFIMHANWVGNARETGLEDPLHLDVKKPRECLWGAPPYEPTTEEFDKRYVQYRTLLGSVKMSHLYQHAKKEISPPVLIDSLKSSTHTPKPKKATGIQGESNDDAGNESEDNKGDEVDERGEGDEKNVEEDDEVEDEEEGDEVDDGEADDEVDDGEAGDEVDDGEADDEVDDGEADDVDNENKTNKGEEDDQNQSQAKFNISTPQKGSQNSNANPLDIWQGEIDSDIILDQPLLSPVKSQTPDKSPD